MYGDFPEDTADDLVPQTPAMGANIGGATLAHGLNSDWDDGIPRGEPRFVRTVGTTAFVETVGVGLQQVDLNEVAKLGQCWRRPCRGI